MYRLLVGFSMGGHGAIRFGLKYSEMFAAVWSVDGAMAASADYLPFVEGRSSGDFRIIAVGGRHNGDRIKRLVDDLGRQGVQIPYDYQNLHHDLPAVVQQDERLGWPAMRYFSATLKAPSADSSASVATTGRSRLKRSPSAPGRR